ncbi:MAG TPA: cytidylate kinase-like family protein [Flammeovirgaceae bacterium]|nr:cytidylate kinase-like family protein [Flammeovirgaceae bacterium]
MYARFTDELTLPRGKHKGVTVTVARDTGWDAIPVVKEVIKQLNANLQGAYKDQPWRYMSKEILEQSAKKLNMKPELLDKLIHQKDRNFVEEILLSLSTENYPNDIKIKRTIKEVVQSAEQEGAVIVVGRAGVAIVAHSKRNLHVKLTAPLEWRVAKIAKEYKVSEEQALKHIKESDKQRENLRKYFMGRKVQPTDYDLILNVATLTKKEVVKAMVELIRFRCLK